jgi:phosphohistidine phosphatase SixA
MRHAEAEYGEQMDPTRVLTPTGKKQAKMMGKWLSRQADAPTVVLQSNFERSQATAKRMAKRLDATPQTIYQLDPDGSPEAAWRTIRKLAKGKSVLAVTHGPLVEKLLAYLIGAPTISQLHFAHAAIAHFDTTAPLSEAKGDYTYEEQEMKRLVLGSGGASGENCEYCQDAADRGWIDMDDVFEGPDEDVDESPLHPNCDCTTEQKTRRTRVYESGMREALADNEGPFAYLHWLVTPNTVARDEDEMDVVSEAAAVMLHDAMAIAEGRECDTIMAR